MKFSEFLDNTEWFDGEIIIAGMETEFSFVWDGEYAFSDYGKEKFAVILNGECTVEDNCIDVDCDADEELVDYFSACVAGYISDTEYNKIIIKKG